MNHTQEGRSPCHEVKLGFEKIIIIIIIYVNLIIVLGFRYQNLTHGSSNRNKGLPYSFWKGKGGDVVDTSTKRNWVYLHKKRCREG